MLLYNGLRVKTTKNRLELLQQQSEQELAAQIQNTIAGVMLHYYDVVRQQRYILTLQQSIGLSEKQLEIVQAKKNVGLANNADIFQSQIDLNTRKQDLQAQQLALLQAQTELLAWLDVAPGSSTLLINDSILVDQNVRLDAVLTALQQNPEITVLDQAININELIEKEIRAQRYPSLRANAGVNYGRNMASGGQLLLNQSYGPFIGLGLSVPIYNGGIFKRQQQTAGLATQNARLQRENALLDYRANAIRTFQAYASSLQQLETQDSTYRLSSQLVDLSLQRFELAAATIVEVREAQKSFEDAAFRLVDLRYTAKIAEIELKRLEGRLGL
jgi:outer membrane protein TolC